MMFGFEINCIYLRHRMCFAEWLPQWGILVVGIIAKTGCDRSNERERACHFWSTFHYKILLIQSIVCVCVRAYDYHAIKQQQTAVFASARVNAVWALISSWSAVGSSVFMLWHGRPVFWFVYTHTLVHVVNIEHTHIHTPYITTPTTKTLCGLFTFVDSRGAIANAVQRHRKTFIINHPFVVECIFWPTLDVRDL